MPPGVQEFLFVGLRILVFFVDFLVAIGGRDWHDSKEVAFAGRARGLGRGLVAIGAAPPRRREDGMGWGFTALPGPTPPPLFSLSSLVTVPCRLASLLDGQLA